MGKKLLIGLSISAIFFSSFATANNQLYDYKQLGLDTPRTAAETAFAIRFSGSRAFDCYKNGKVVFGIGVNALFLSLEERKKVEEQHENRFHSPFNWKESNAYIRIQAGIDKKDGFHETYNSVGKPLFDSNDSQRYMVVDLLNGKKVEFTRFGPIPDFPFNTRKKLKPFFYYQVEGEPRYECGAVDQPN